MLPGSALTCPPAHSPCLPSLSAPLMSRLHPLVTCLSASAVSMFPVSPHSYLLLPPPPDRLPPVPSRIAVAARTVPSHSVSPQSTCFSSTRKKKRDNKSEKKKEASRSTKNNNDRIFTRCTCLPPSCPALPLPLALVHPVLPSCCHAILKKR